jgi:Protein of unknown function (DUF3551)
MATGKRQIVAGGWLVATVLAASALDVGIASAQPTIGNGRWCVTLSHLGGTLQCSYRSLEQCMFYARGVSNQCSLNPWYEAPARPRGKRDAGMWR